MKKFFHDYSYSMVKMFVNQFAISIFGVSLTFATTHAHIGSTGFDFLTLIVSILATIFYLFLIYTLSWEVGSKDRVAVDAGKKPYRSYTGLLMSLVANIPNLLAAILYLIATLINSNDMLFIVRLIASLIQGMFFGTITAVSLPVGAGGAWVQLNALWPTFFIMVVPTLIVCWIAYVMGYKNFRVFAFLSNKDPKGGAGDPPQMKK